MFEKDLEGIIEKAKGKDRRAWVVLLGEYRELFEVVVSTHNFYIYEEKEELWSLALENLPLLVERYRQGNSPYSFFYTGTRQILKWKLIRIRAKDKRMQEKFQRWAMENGRLDLLKAEAVERMENEK